MLVKTYDGDRSLPGAHGSKKGRSEMRGRKTEQHSYMGLGQQQHKHTRPPNGWPLPARPPTPKNADSDGSGNAGPSPFPSTGAGNKVFGPLHKAWKRKWD
jgi:hypothetical protein